MYEFLHTNSSLAKGCLILENLKQNVPNYAPGQYPPKKILLRGVIWHLFLEIWAEVKNFLR